MILELDQQCAPYDLCRRLKDLGAPQDTAFMWLAAGRIRDRVPVVVRFLLRAVRELDTTGAWSDPRIQLGTNPCAAYTVAELGAMLPGDCNLTRLDDGQLYADHGGATLTPSEGFGSTEAEARAKLLIALTECGVVTWPAVKA